jgi:hypothetical protein
VPPVIGEDGQQEEAEEDAGPETAFEIGRVYLEASAAGDKAGECLLLLTAAAISERMSARGERGEEEAPVPTLDTLKERYLGPLRRSLADFTERTQHNHYGTPEEDFSEYLVSTLDDLPPLQPIAEPFEVSMVFAHLLFGSKPCKEGSLEMPDDADETANTGFRLGRLYYLARCTPVESFLEACSAVAMEWMQAHPEELRPA